MIEINSLEEIYGFIDGIKAVVFDLDDTLYNEIDYVKSGFNAVAKALPEIKNASERLFELFLRKEKPIDTLLEENGIFSENVKDKCVNAYRMHMPKISLSREVETLLIKLKKRNLKMGVITDGRPEGQRAKIKALKLEKFVDDIIVTDELGGTEFRKPNPEAFRIMCQRLSVEYFEMCYVGDNILKDFIAPCKLKMKSIYYKNPNGLYC